MNNWQTQQPRRLGKWENYFLGVLGSFKGKAAGCGNMLGGLYRPWQRHPAGPTDAILKTEKSSGNKILIFDFEALDEVEF